VSQFKPRIEDVTATDGVTSYNLRVKSAQVTLDDSWSPYAQATLTCARPSAELLDFLDPRDTVRVSFTLTRSLSGQSRDFDLLLIERELDNVTDELTLYLGGDESLLLGDALMASTPTDAAFAEQASLRTIIDDLVLDPMGAALEADDGADADLTVYTDAVNLITNPSGEVNTTGWTATACTLSRISGGTAPTSGTYALRLQTPTNANSYITSDAISVTAGATYILAGTMLCVGTAGGTANTYRRCLTVADATTNSVIAVTPNGPGSGMTNPESQSVQFTVPAGTTSVKVRCYLGTGTSGDIRFDSLLLMQVTGALTDGTYFDGDTTDTAIYNYAWSGTAHNSTSVRTNISGLERSLDMFTRDPGESWWDFLEPLLQVGGLRLFCDEQRKWHLVSRDAVVSGLIAVNAGVNYTDGVDAIKRDSDEWADAVVIKYTWKDSAGVDQVAYDYEQEGTGATANCLLVEYSRPFPGVGAAAAILARANARGRTLSPGSIADLDATPGMEVQVTQPDTPLQDGQISAVIWQLPAGTMQLRTRGLGDVLEDTWAFVDDALVWDAVSTSHEWVDGVP
jgi:hypothetical protein